jgi:DNA-3-methyladenine glycosylase II
MWKKAEGFLLKDRHLSSLVKKHGPCRIAPSKVEDYFMDLVESIVEQQLSGKAADTIFRRLKTGVGAGRGRISPTHIIGFPDKKIRGFGLSWAKVKYIKDLSEKVDGGELNLKTINTLSDEEVITELIKVKGIGRWTAEMFLMFSLTRPDIFPVDDLGIRKGLKVVTKKDFSAEKMLAFSTRWKPYRTIASWYIWRALEN